jgi:FkbM family methyltransferase
MTVRPVSRAAALVMRLMPRRMRARIAQSLTDGRLAGRRRSERFRRELIRRDGDPVVRVDVDGTTLELPLSHPLPAYRRRYPSYSENLGAVARLVADAGGRTMIDVGANVGDSAAIVKAHAPEMAILCIDADPAYVPFLRSNTARWPDVEVAAPALLGPRTEDVPGSMSRARGTSRFTSSSPGTTAAVRLDDLVAERSHFSAPALLKSDTDGFEDHVLSGATATLAAGPALFLEYDPKLLRDSGADGLRMLAGLRSFGYVRVAFYDKFGKLMIRCSLNDEALLRDLDAYASGNPEGAVDHYDIVVVTPALSAVIDALET